MGTNIPLWVDLRENFAMSRNALWIGRATLCAAAVLAIAAGHGCGASDPAEGAYVTPLGFTLGQASKVAMQPYTFQREGGRVATNAVFSREVKRNSAKLAKDSPSKDPADEHRLEVEFLGNYHEGTRVAISAQPRAYVDVIPVAAEKSVAPRVREDGAIVSFEGAYRNITAAFGGTEKKVEEFLVIPTKEDVPKLQYLIKPGPEFGEWLEGMGQLWGFSKENKPLFALTRPVAIDFSGKTVYGEWQMERGEGQITVTAKMDYTGLQFPVLFDPSFETPSWYLGTNGSVPGGLAGSAASYSPGKTAVVLFGGATGSASSPYYTNATYVRGSGTWQSSDVTSGTKPNARAYATLANEDATGNDLIMFGGYDESASGTGESSETWRLTLAGASPAITGTWSQLSPAASPSARFMHGSAWNGSNVIIWGGIARSSSTTTTVYSDTWQWTGATWTQICTGGSSFSGRYGFAVARTGTEAAPTAIYALGGATISGNTGSLSSFTVQKYTTAGCWSTLSASAATVPQNSAGTLSTCTGATCTSASGGYVSPLPRVAAWAGRTVNNNVIVGGGYDGSSSDLSTTSDAWLLHIADSSFRWERVPVNSTNNIPGARESAAAVYDQNNSNLVLFGGYTALSNNSVSANPRLYKGVSSTGSFKLAVRCLKDGDASGTCDGTEDALQVFIYNATNLTTDFVTNAQVHFVRRPTSGTTAWTNLQTTTSCTTDNDCPGNIGGSCSGGSCSNSNCGTSATPLTATANGLWCNATADCPNLGTARACPSSGTRSNKCQIRCTSDADCPGAGVGTCTQPTCTVNADCPFTSSCVGGNCTTEKLCSTNCTADSHCYQPITDASLTPALTGACSSNICKTLGCVVAFPTTSDYIGARIRDKAYQSGGSASCSSNPSAENLYCNPSGYAGVTSCDDSAWNIGLTPGADPYQDCNQ